MALPWTIAATLPCALLVYGFTDSSPNALQRHGGSLSTHLTREALWPGFEGNSDFYGLGIRIGVYLQWFSAWISNTVNPAGAAANHDANTIFLTAITVATSVALSGGALQPAEAYLMLLLSNGFLFTVLSFLGLRLYLLQPSTAAVLRRNLSTAWNDFATSRSDESGEEHQASWLSRLYNAPRVLLTVWPIDFGNSSDDQYLTAFPIHGLCLSCVRIMTLYRFLCREQTTSHYAIA